VLALGIIIWETRSPERALAKLQGAASRADAQELASSIDIASVRRSAEKQARGEISTWIARFKNERDNFAAIEGDSAKCAIDLALDKSLTMDSVGHLILKGWLGPTLRLRPGSTPNAEWHIDRRAVGEFRASSDEPQSAVLVFKRHGINWRLDEIVLPGGGFAPWVIVEPPVGGFAADHSLPVC
jgi:Protein of unknown function (DUF2939).